MGSPDGPPRCSVCGEVQVQTFSGMVCKNGHGGAPEVEKEIDRAFNPADDEVAATRAEAAARRIAADPMLEQERRYGGALTPARLLRRKQMEAEARGVPRSRAVEMIERQNAEISLEVHKEKNRSLVYRLIAFQTYLNNNSDVDDLREEFARRFEFDLLEA